MEQDIRWKQRFENFDRATKKLLVFSAEEEKHGGDIHQVALIGAFKFTFELGWKTLKDYLGFSGVDVSMPRDVIKQAFHHNLIEDGQVWIDMLMDRNILSHVYDEKKLTLPSQTSERSISRQSSKSIPC
jgi:nucleotidyltransferase substrate binding protein (TIGR01987 family)